MLVKSTHTMKAHEYDKTPMALFKWVGDYRGHKIDTNLYTKNRALLIIKPTKIRVEYYTRKSQLNHRIDRLLDK
jgi:hypothetical protein